MSGWMSGGEEAGEAFMGSKPEEKMSLAKWQVTPAQGSCRTESWVKCQGESCRGDQTSHPNWEWYHVGKTGSLWLRLSRKTSGIVILCAEVLRHSLLQWKYSAVFKMLECSPCSMSPGDEQCFLTWEGRDQILSVGLPDVSSDALFSQTCTVQYGSHQPHVAIEHLR